MKAIKFFVTILLMAVMPMLIVSCKERNEPTNNTTGSGSTGPTITASIVGDWELLEITKTKENRIVPFTPGTKVLLEDYLKKIFFECGIGG